MRIALRVLLGYFLIVALAALLLVNVFVQQVKPGVRQAMEDTLADTANVLAELATDDLLAGHIADGRFAARVRAMSQRTLDARIWGEDKQRTSYRIAELSCSIRPARKSGATIRAGTMSGAPCVASTAHVPPATTRMTRPAR